MITRYIWLTIITLSVSVDLVFCESSMSIEPDVALVGGSTTVNCETSLPAQKISSSMLYFDAVNNPTTTKAQWEGQTLKPLIQPSTKLLPSTFPVLRLNFMSVKCKDTGEYKCSFLGLHGEIHAQTSHLIVIDNSQSVKLRATSQCTGNDCSKCGTPGFTGSVHRVNDEVTFECSKEMTFHENVTNYFKWSIYRNGAWDPLKSAPQSTTQVYVKPNKQACLASEARKHSISYTPKTDDPGLMKVKCVAEMHIHGKLRDSKEGLHNLCVLGTAVPAPTGGTPAPTVNPLGNRGNAGPIIDGVVGVAAFAAVGVGYY